MRDVAWLGTASCGLRSLNSTPLGFVLIVVVFVSLCCISRLRIPIILPTISPASKELPANVLQPQEIYIT